MKHELIPFYISRAILATVLGWGVSAALNQWIGALLGVLVFAGFIWYAHSGRFLIDSSNPLFPFKRDDRGNAIRDKGVVIAVGVSGLIFALVTVLSLFVSVKVDTASITFGVGAATYFIVSNWHYAKR